MRQRVSEKIFDQEEEKTNDGLIQVGEVAGWPFLMLINAQGERNTLASIVQALLLQVLSVLIRVNKLTEFHGIQSSIDKLCEKFVSDVQNTYRMKPQFHEKKGVSFSVILMLTGPSQAKRAFCFGLGDVMILLERNKRFETIKPAIFSDGLSRCVPCILEEEEEKISEIKKELSGYARVVELLTADKLHLLSPMVYRFLQCNITSNSANEQIFSVRFDPKISAHGLIELAKEKFREATKRRSLEERDKASTRLIRVEEECARHNEELENIEEKLKKNKMFEQGIMLGLLRSNLESEVKAREAKERRGQEVKFLGYSQLTKTQIDAHNSLKPSQEEQEEYIHFNRRKKEINSQLFKLEARKAKLLNVAHLNREPNFSHCVMRVPASDFSIFELRVSSYLDLLFQDNYSTWVHQVSQSADCLPLPLRNYHELFSNLFNNSFLGRALVLLLICETDWLFAEFLFDQKTKPNINTLISGLNGFGQEERRALEEEVAFLKKICQDETIDQELILARVMKLEDLLIHCEHVEEENDTRSLTFG